MSIYFKDKFYILRGKYELTQEEIAEIFHVLPSLTAVRKRVQNELKYS